MKTILIVLFFMTSFFVRALRWLAVMQQKEYRFDRLLLFLYSSEGLTELFRLFPQRTDFSKSGLKRPKLTKRSLLLAAIFLVISIFYFKVILAFGNQLLLQWYPYPFWYNFILLLCAWTLYLILIPVFALLSVIPTVVVAYLQTYKRLFQANKIITQSKPTVIGITGSYGKTSTKMLLAHVLERKYSVFMTPKSYNTKYSVAHSIVTGYKTEQIALIEYAAYKKGEIKELAKWVKPGLAIVTGLTHQHVGLFGSLQEIIEAKAELVSSLPLQATAFCNTYDEQTKEICTLGSKHNKAKIVCVNPTYPKVTLTSVRVGDNARLQFNWDGRVVHTKLIGAQYIEVVHLVIVVALQLKMKQEEIIAALESFTPNEKFVMTFTLSNGVKVIDDGDTSNPKGFLAMVRLAKSVTVQKKVLITPGIVDLADESQRIHSELATQSKQVFSTVVFVGESGKTEFQEVFRDKLLTTEGQLQELLSALSAQDLIIIEGRMPAWAAKYLK